MGESFTGYQDSGKMIQNSWKLNGGGDKKIYFCSFPAVCEP